MTIVVAFLHAGLHRRLDTGRATVLDAALHDLARVRARRKAATVSAGAGGTDTKGALAEHASAPLKLARF